MDKKKSTLTVYIKWRPQVYIKVYTTHMPRVQIYLTDETYLIYTEIENKSLWVQDKLYELEKENKDG